jgi:hypothetical protein
MLSFFDRIAAAVEREYDRRIRRASLIHEYGTTHHGAETSAHAALDDEDSDVEIANVPRGAVLMSSEHHTTDAAGMRDAG